MGINFGEKLRSLRIDRQLTQEQLGFELGFSPQAISRWEINGTFPDLTTLIAAADFFDVTLDELVNRKNEFSSEEKAEFDKNYAQGSLDDKIALTREMVKKYPTNDYLLFILLNCLNSKRIKTKSTEFNEEIFVICQKIQRVSKNVGYIVGSHSVTARVFADTNQPKKAVEIASALPSFYCSREFVMRAVSKGADKLSCCQFNALALMDNINCELQRISILTFSNRRKIEILNTANGMILSLIGDNAGFYNLRLSENHLKIAEIYCREKNSENTLKHLDLAISYAEKYELDSEHSSYNAVWLMGYKTEDNQKTENETFFNTIANRIMKDDFNFMRGIKQFETLNKKVQRYIMLNKNT